MWIAKLLNIRLGVLNKGFTFTAEGTIIVAKGPAVVDSTELVVFARGWMWGRGDRPPVVTTT